jgi:hypothetical protein
MHNDVRVTMVIVSIGSVAELGRCLDIDHLSISPGVRCESEKMVRSQDRNPLKYHVGRI